MINFYDYFSTFNPVDGPESARNDRAGRVIQSSMSLLREATLADLQIRAMSIDMILTESGENSEKDGRPEALQRSLARYDIEDGVTNPVDRMHGYFAVLALRLVELSMRSPKTANELLEEAEQSLKLAKQHSTKALLKTVDSETKASLFAKGVSEENTKAAKIRGQRYARHKAAAIELYKRGSWKGVSEAAREIFPKVKDMSPRMVGGESSLRTVRDWLYKYKNSKRD